MIKKILIIGCGGIGSYLIEHICDKMEKQQIDKYIKFEIADDDMIEIAQINYQNFKLQEMGMSKSKALAKRFKDYGVWAIERRIDKVKWLGGYDGIILCVDNDKTRKMVVEYCHSNHTEFIDLRATGRKFFAMPKTNLKENLKFIDSKVNKDYSCQEKEDLEKGLYQIGNEIVAKIGTQMLLNLLRGHNNRIINGVI